MFTLFTTIISFLSGGLPKILDFFQDRQDKQHELAMAELQLNQQIELQKLGYTANKELEEIKFSELQEQDDSTDLGNALNNDIETSKGASIWVVNIRALIRPAITFGFFSIFLFVELFGCYYAIHTGVDFNVAVQQLWTEDTQTVWASIIGFYFGCRHFAK